MIPEDKIAREHLRLLEKGQYNMVRPHDHHIHTLLNIVVHLHQRIDTLEELVQKLWYNRRDP